MSFVSPSNMDAGSGDGVAKSVARSPIVGVVSRLDVPSCRFGEATGWGLRFGIGGGAGAPAIFAGEPRWGCGGGGAAAPLKRL
jgi:hypothetical protein